MQSGKCLFFWEFPTAVKRVAFNEDDDQVVCITEQRMGFQGAVRIFNINRDGDGTSRKFNPAFCYLLRLRNGRRVNKNGHQRGG